MSERITFVESFDHAGPAFTPAKYLHALGTTTEVAGPYHGVAARFGAPGDELGPAARGTLWDSGAWSAGVKVDATGWAGAGEVAFLAPAYWDGSPTGDFPHHWLTVDAAGTLRVRSWPPSGSTTLVLATSAAGALPLGAWARLEYRTQIRGSDTTAGTLGVRVNGTAVLTATGLQTSDPQRAVIRADHFRFGHLATSAVGEGGVGGLGAGGAAVGVAVDDVCQRQDTALGAALLADRDDPALPHRVVCLFPTGPGLAAELPRTGAAANWQACAEAPPDGDTSTVERQVVPAGVDPLPVDLYATTPAPAIVEGAAGAALVVWGLARSADSPPRATLRVRDGLGAETSLRGAVAAAYRYLPYNPLPLSPEGLTDAQLAGLQIGWASRSTAESPRAQTFVGTQVVAELWYRPGAAPEPEPGGAAQRWSVGWVG